MAIVRRKYQYNEFFGIRIQAYYWKIHRFEVYMGNIR